MFLAFLLRFYKLGQVPVSLYWDEAAILIDAKTVAQTGLDMHSRPWFQLLYPSYGDFKLPVYIWLSSISIKLFSVGEWQLRLTSALAGMGSILFAGLIAKELSNSESEARNFSLATMLVVTISPWAIMFSRTGFEGHLAQFFVAVSIYFLLLSKRLDKYLILITAVLFGSLATYTYFSVRFVWPAVFLIFQVLLGSKIKIDNNLQIFCFFRWVIAKLLLPILLFFILLIPMFKSPFYKTSNQYRYSADSVLNCCEYALDSNKLRELASNNFFDRLIFHRHLLLLKELAKNYSDNLSANFLFLNGDPNLRHGTGEHGLFLLPLSLALISGFYYLAKKDWKVLFFLLGWWFAALLPASVPETTPHALRSLNALLPISLIMGFGLAKIIKNYFFKKTKFIIFSYFLLIGISFVNFSYHYFVYYPKDSARDWQDAYKEIAMLIEEKKDNVDILLVEPNHNRLFIWYLAYVVDAEIIQSLPSKNFKFEQIESIYFTDNDWSKHLSSAKKIILVGEKKYIENQLSEIERIPIQNIEINNYASTNFILVEL